MKKHLAAGAFALALSAAACAAAAKEAPVTGADRVVDVVICEGSTAQGYVECLRACNEQHLLPGVAFRWRVVEQLKAEDLAGKHVVMFPGGAAPQPGQVNVPALQAFVRAGGGYYGTCAGAIAAIREFGLTPQVKGKGAEFQGCVDVRMTDWGARIFGYGGNVILKCWNGWAFYDPADVLGPCGFWDRNHQGDRPRCGERSWPARGDKPAYTEKRAWQTQFDLGVSGEKYMQSYVARLGEGRVVVVNAHPEIGKGRGYWMPRWVGAGVAWAAGRENVLGSYRLGFDQGLYDESSRRFSPAPGGSLLCQREYVSETGTIRALSVLLGGSAGEVVAGIYDGESRPERCVARSAPTPVDPGWRSITLAEPLRVRKGQTIWLGAIVRSPEQALRCARFPDVNGDTFEDRAWVSSVRWSDLRGARLPDAPAGATQEYLVCLFADVDLDKTD